MASQSITKDMTIQEILVLFPGAAEIMVEYQLHCADCVLGGRETLAEAKDVHGMDDELFEALVMDLNDEFKNQPEQPQELIITPEAARGIREIAEAEDHKGQILRVVLDETGGFCMEFQDKSEEGDLEFGCSKEPDVKVYVSPITLQRIGGATIDVRDGRFKLDLPEQKACCKGEGNSCGCK